jgi:predicted transcriptional regulator
MAIDPAAEAPSERDVAAKQRLVREAELLVEAWADVAAGRLVSLEAVEAWVESWYTDREIAPPSSRR